MDTALFYAVNHGLENPFFNIFMPLLSRYPNWIPIFLGIFGYFIYRDKKRGIFFFLLVVVAVTASDFICSGVLKKIFATPRPCLSLPDVHLLAGCSNSGSFPSSHAANSAAIATMLGLYDRRFWWFGIPAALLVCISRLYLGVHYPSDVAGGALVGAAVAYGVMRLSGMAEKNRPLRNNVAAVFPIQ